MIAAQFRKEASHHAWDQRAHKMFWTGVDGLSDIRYKFRACSKEHPHTIAAAGGVDWNQLRNQESRLNTFARPGVHLKPIEGDLRKLAQFKFGIYLTGHSWSSSLKRIAVAGLAITMPSPPEYEDLTTLLLDSCNCTYNFNPKSKRMCRDLDELVKHTPDDEAKKRAELSTQLVSDGFSQQQVEDYMTQVLRTASATQDLSQLTPTRLVEAGFERVTCPWLKAKYRDVVGEHLYWQIEEWMDTETCLFEESRYLDFIAVRRTRQ